MKPAAALAAIVLGCACPATAGDGAFRPIAAGPLFPNDPGDTTTDPVESLEALDWNGDGRLDADERAAAGDALPARGHSAWLEWSRRTGNFDVDGDGRLDAAERDAMRNAMADADAFDFPRGTQGAAPGRPRAPLATDTARQNAPAAPGGFRRFGLGGGGRAGGHAKSCR